MVRPRVRGSKDAGAQPHRIIEGTCSSRALSDAARSVHASSSSLSGSGCLPLQNQPQAVPFKCARASCPCPATYNGRSGEIAYDDRSIACPLLSMTFLMCMCGGSGEYCCMTCRRGTPCTHPLHTQASAGLSGDGAATSSPVVMQKPPIMPHSAHHGLTRGLGGPSTGLPAPQHGAVSNGILSSPGKRRRAVVAAGMASVESSITPSALSGPSGGFRSSGMPPKAPCARQGCPCSAFDGITGKRCQRYLRRRKADIHLKY